MEKQKRIPKRRFREFLEAGEWEERQLQDIADKSTEKNKNSIYQETFTNSAEYGIINQRDFFDKDISNKENISAYFIVRPENFIYNPRISSSAPVGPINCNRLGRVGIMSPLYTVFSTKDIDNLFLEKYFQSEHWHQFMYFNGDTGARSDRFSIKDDVFFTMPISHPSHAEQKKIGNFCRRLDTLIALHQQKLSKLKNLKQAYLTEMFPAPGEKRPRRRFKGFSGDWEECLIEDIATFAKGIGFSKTDLCDKGLPIILYGRLYTNYQMEITEVDSYVPCESVGLLSKGNEVIVPASGETAEDIAIASAVRKKGIILGGDLNVIYPTDRINPSFLALIISTGCTKINLSKMAQGKTVVHLHNEEIKKLSILFPSLSEQEKIVDIFRRIDSNIKSIVTKISKLQSLKQAYLSELFV